MAETLATVSSIGTPLANAAPAPDTSLDVTRGMTGRRKAAVLVLQLDRNAAARVLSPVDRSGVGRHRHRDRSGR